MLNFNPKIEIKKEEEPIPKDISKEFLEMEIHEFLAFLRSLRNEPALSIVIDWQGIWKARRLKAFLEEYDALIKGQKRTAAIRATEEQHKEELNVFASGVKWIKI